MIGYLRGQIAAISEDNIIIDVGGVGYNVLVTTKTAEALSRIGDEVKVYTYLSVREDAMKLFGFSSADELDMFKKLITVNGIGPKNAMGVLSVMDTSDIRFAILSGDAKTLSKCPGVGNKSAQKIILELKDKVDIEQTINNIQSGDATIEPLSDARKEAAEALSALGYSATEAMKAVKSVPDAESMDVETLLKAALKYL